MKKAIFLIILLATAGFIYWFLMPQQQLKRKSQRVLDSYTVEKDSSQAGAAAGSLFIDSMFTSKVAIDADEKVHKQLKYLNMGSVSRDQLTTAHQKLNSYAKQFSHSTGGMTVTKVADERYEVSFPHTIEMVAGFKGVSYTKKINSTTTFTFDKSEGSYKVSKITFR